MAIADRQEKRNLFCRVGNELGAGLDEVGQAHHREPHRRGATVCAGARWFAFFRCSGLHDHSSA